MKIVLLTALGVGASTILGALIGFAFRKISHKFSDIVLSFAAGVMLSAAVIGLILPSLGYGGEYGLPVTVAGIFCGALCINLIDKLVPHLHRMTGTPFESHPEANARLNKVLLFVIAIAIHNFPEGIAAGVGFGTGDTASALTVAAGVSKKKTLLCALLTGVVEVIGTLIGYLAVSVATAILPFALAFAGGTMLYVVSDEMIPETHSHGSERGATYSLLAGFCLMLIFDVLLG